MTNEQRTGSSWEVPVTDPVAFYQHGWHSWCATGWVPPHDPRRQIADERDRLGHDDPLHAFDQVPGGSGLGAVEHTDGSVTLLGALTGGAWVRYQDGSLVGEYEEGSGPWVTLTGEEREVFGRYARLVAEQQGRRGGPPMRLWASWYSYYENVTEQIMRDVLAGLEGFDFDVIQIDDGWERTIGDWVPNDDFPNGMADIAGRIQDTGRRAGLWLAPFVAMPDSQLVTDRPELVLRTSDGDPVVAGVNWGGPYWALDVTLEDTLEYLAGVFGGLAESGYTFFKLDFIYAAAYPGAHANPMPRADAYRRACRRIRDAVGPDTYLLACGAPIIDSIGVFDGIRVGPDVGPVWDDGTYAAAHRAMLAAVHRLWLRPAIDTDPDVAYFRTTELSSETSRRLQDLAHIAGFLGTSDPPDRLNDAQRRALTEGLQASIASEQLSRYRWRLGEREVDFSPALAAGTTEPEWEEAG